MDNAALTVYARMLRIVCCAVRVCAMLYVKLCVQDPCDPFGVFTAKSAEIHWLHHD